MVEKVSETSEIHKRIVYETGSIGGKDVDQIREGHYWGVPLVMMADKSGVTVKPGETLEMAMLPKDGALKNFCPIPTEGNIDFEVRTELEDEKEIKTVFASSNAKIRDLVEFEKTQEKISLLEEINEVDTELVSLKTESLPHKDIWNRVEEVAEEEEEGGKANVIRSEEYKKLKTVAGEFDVHLDKHEDFLAQFDTKFFGLIEIISQNVGAAIFGEEEMAGMFQKVKFSPFLEEDQIDFQKEATVKFSITPIEGKKERNWTIIATAQQEGLPLMSIEADCSIMNKRGLVRMFYKMKLKGEEMLAPDKAITETKGKVTDVVGDGEGGTKEVVASKSGY